MWLKWLVVLKLVGLVIAARRRDENIGAARRKQPRPLLAPPFRPAAHPGARRKRNEDSGCRGEAGSESRGRGVPRLQSTNMFYMRTCTRVRDNLARHNELTLSYAKLSLQLGNRSTGIAFFTALLTSRAGRDLS